PRIVGAEVPDMTFGIAACVAPAAEVIVLQVHYDLGPRGLGSGAVGIRIADPKIATLCLGAPDFIWLLHVFVERGVAKLCEHEHGVAEGQLSVMHHSIFAGGDRMLLEPESGAQPIASRANIAITKCNT